VRLVSQSPDPRGLGFWFCLLILYISIAVFKLIFFAKIKGHRPCNHPLCYPVTCWVGELRSPRDLIWTLCSRLNDGIKQRSNLPPIEKLEFPVHRTSDIALEKKLKRQSVRVQSVQDRFEKVNEVKNLTPMSRCNVETLWKMNPNPGAGIILDRYCIDSSWYFWLGGTWLFKAASHRHKRQLYDGFARYEWKTAVRMKL
jgi:hypothetical protein